MHNRADKYKTVMTGVREEKDPWQVIWIVPKAAGNPAMEMRKFLGRFVTSSSPVASPRRPLPLSRSRQHVSDRSSSDDGIVEHEAPALPHFTVLNHMRGPTKCEIRTVHFVMLPPKALCDADTSPLLLRQQSQRAGVIIVEEVLRDHLEEWFGEDHMTIFVLVVRVSLRVVNSASGVTSVSDTYL